MIEEIFEGHKEVLLFYSGGKDSLALLLLLRPYWDRVNVVWVDTGNQFPEVYRHMDKVKAMVPHFTTLRSNVNADIQANGMPVDVVPMSCTNFGINVFGKAPIRVRSMFECCNNNLWMPMQMYISSTRPTCVLRGDRSSERVKGPNNWEGIEFAFPIWDWTDEQVWNFLKENGNGLVEERHCMRHGTSLDCMACSAYNKEIPERLLYLKKHYPDLYESVLNFYEKYKQVVMNEMNLLKEQK